MRIRMSCKLAALVLAIIMLTSCGASAGRTDAAGTSAAATREKYQRQVIAMDTVMILTAYGPKAEEALEAAEAKILALEADLDPASPAGSVYALNAGAGGQVVVSEDAYSVMSTMMARWTRGCTRCRRRGGSSGANTAYRPGRRSTPCFP